MTRLTGLEHYDPGDLTIGDGRGLDGCATVSHGPARTVCCLLATLPSPSAPRSAGCWQRDWHGPLRHGYGGLRDYCIGVRFVTGDGAQGQRWRARGEERCRLRLDEAAHRQSGNAGDHHERQFQAVSRAPANADFCRRVCHCRQKRLASVIGCCIRRCRSDVPGDWFRPSAGDVRCMAKPDVVANRWFVQRQRRRAGPLSGGVGIGGYARAGRKRRTIVWRASLIFPTSTCGRRITALLAHCVSILPLGRCAIRFPTESSLIAVRTALLSQSVGAGGVWLILLVALWPAPEAEATMAELRQCRHQACAVVSR